MSVSATTNAGLYAIEKLSDDNYHSWSFKAKMILINKDLWSAVQLPETSAYTTPPDSVLNKDAGSTEDQKALANIALMVSDSQLSHITSMSNARRAWYALQRAHERSGLTSKVFLKQELFTKRKDPTAKIQAHINEMTVIRDRLAAIGSATSDEDFAILLLISCREDYGDLLTAINARDSELSASYVTSQLLQAEQHKEKMGKSESVALMARSLRGRTECYYCHEHGHMKYNCPKKKEADERREQTAAISIAL